MEQKDDRIIKLSWDDVYREVAALSAKIPQHSRIYGVPRGGAIVAALVKATRANELHLAEHPDQATVIVDDLIDSGRTRKIFAETYPDKPFLALWGKNQSQHLKDSWLQFPWEETMQRDVEDHVVRILEAIGEDPTRDGLRDTPRRHIAYLKEFTKVEPPKMTVFDSDEYDEIVAESNIPFHSLCEHHLLPFFGEATVAYIPSGKKIVGLSKLARLVDFYSRRLANQERITKQIADAIEQILKPRGVAVILKARHMCMEMRGVRKPGVNTTTSTMRGIFKEDYKARQELLILTK